MKNSMAANGYAFLPVYSVWRYRTSLLKIFKKEVLEQIMEGEFCYIDGLKKFLHALYYVRFLFSFSYNTHKLLFCDSPKKNTSSPGLSNENNELW